ncbi:hypothetical protein ATO13_22221 [Stappia sp. 22II-S9-Z10]|nr:hypothetical protein ATO13_22221 [Stappia sp. 22II-S9-Z10]
MSAAVAEVLRKARGYVERGWTQRSFARGPDGAVVSPVDASATCWCSIGAIMAASNYDMTVYVPASDALRAAIAGSNLPRWNDDLRRTLADVLAAFDKAIAAAEREALS